jgi:AI-2 transport protein TqsA
MRDREALEKLALILLGVAGVAGLCLFFRSTSEVFVPFAVALILALSAQPIVEWLTRHRLPSPLPILAVVASALVFLGIAILLVEQAADSVIQMLPQFKTRAIDLLTTVSSRIGLSPQPLENLGKEPETLKTLAGVSGSTALSVVGAVSQFLLIMLYLVFLLLGRRHLPGLMQAAFGSERAKAGLAIVTTLERQMFRYVLYRSTLSFVTALAVWIILLLYKIKLSGLFALLTFFAQYVPFVGPFVMSLLPVAMALVQYPGVSTAGWIVLWLGIWHLFVGFVLEPRVFSVGLSLNQTLVLLGLALFAWIWGIVGMLLWVPLMLAFRLVCQQVPALRPLGILFGRANAGSASPAS